MTKEEIFNYFLTNSANFGTESILFSMLAGVCISILIYITYYITYRGVNYNSKFNNSLIVISLISNVIMQMISSNIAISLGMVGALSIVRFRTAIKDSRDTVFIFWAITEGLCVGSQNFKLATLTSLVIAAIFIVLSFLPTLRNKYLLVIRGGEEEIKADSVNRVLRQFTTLAKLRAANRDEEHQEMIYEIKTKKELDPELITRLTEINGVKSINYVVESGENVG